MKELPIAATGEIAVQLPAMDSARQHAAQAAGNFSHRNSILFRRRGVLSRTSSPLVHHSETKTRKISVENSTKQLRSIVQLPTVCRQTRTAALVVGGGPAGSAIATLLAKKGHRVTLSERCPPNPADETANESSYNFTLVGRSIQLFSQLGIDITPDCLEIVGRQIHTPGGTSLHAYGTRETDVLFSVPRRTVVSKLRAAAINAGVEFVQGATLEDLDARRGTARFTHASQDTEIVTADRIFVADGANSRGQSSIVRQADVRQCREPDGLVYALAKISADRAFRAGLRPNHIQFVPGPTSIDIAIANADGTFNLLMERLSDQPVSRIDCVDRIQPFQSGPPPLLRDLVVDLEGQLLNTPVRRFKYSCCGIYCFEKAVLVGDAAHCWPPYLGQGVNAALHDVASFAAAEQMGGGDWKKTLTLYAEDRQRHCQKLDKLAAHHGRQILTGQFGGWNWRVADRTERMVERLTGRRSLYQRMVFDMPLPFFSS